MKINKKLILIKAQFFVYGLAIAPIHPYIVIIAKGLGFSSVSVGWIYTVYPVLTVFLKPVFGSVADKFKILKSMFVLLLVIHGAAMLAVKSVPPLPSSSPVTLGCAGEAVFCAAKLGEDCYSQSLLEELNTTKVCKMRFSNNQSSHQYIQNKLISSHHVEDISVLIDTFDIQNGCLFLRFKNDSAFDSVLESSCSGTNLTSAELFCEKRLLDELLTKPAISDTEQFLTYQFWMLFLIVITVRVSGSIVNSVADAITFELLGEKREQFGLQRMWAAAGWGIASLVVGYVTDMVSRGKPKNDYTYSFYISAVAVVLHIVLVSFIKVNQVNESKSIAKDVKNLFKDVRICIFIVWCIVSGIYVSFVWNFLFWFIEDLAAQGGCGSAAGVKTLEGLVLTIHCYAGEIPFFFFSGRILKKIGHVNAMTLVLFTFGVRFILYSSLTNPWYILPIECLNGITFGIFYATMATYASVISPPGTEATVQNLVAALFEGVGCGVGALIGGYLFKLIGSSSTFFVVGCSAIFFAGLHVLAHKVVKNVKSDVYKSVTMAKPAENGNNEKDLQCTIKT